ncbi:hypothetical protein [Paenibacillus macerans]|nr:hypothetical protein [Paenibacillus macerans]MCY7561568.1 hypothetical protein [Paenibacillus macerans]MEC0153333.1 hypothetical protein [Paenibacillus macerans]SUA84811.1 Uncharacterised protein [Paenibacillus macerans]
MSLFFLVLAVVLFFIGVELMFIIGRIEESMEMSIFGLFFLFFGFCGFYFSGVFQKVLIGDDNIFTIIFESWLAMKLGIQILLVIMWLYIPFFLYIILKDIFNFVELKTFNDPEDDIKDKRTFTHFRNANPYRVLHIFIFLFLFPIWVTELLMWLIGQIIFITGKLIFRVSRILSKGASKVLNLPISRKDNE